MQRRWRLLILTFIESFATICVERSGPFFTRERLHFTDAENLYLALALGVAYAIGAISSHAIALRIREKRLLVATIVGQIVVHLVLCSGCPPR